ncbi:putative nuclease HARBI1 [Mycena venus]|uniref:Putative nuclease HARBI1 n=1 Tax=Mycena venus TaxID=2733690 RepID=A0A8H7DFA7_9AGAR|nr:putative nuclease HARBI1 [Mycena venus]
MNCLACCSQDMLFQYVLSGWEGSVADAALYLDARLNDLTVPAGKYYLADAGFGSCDATLVPYRGFRYHLAEQGRASVRPASREELFNLRHASARNIIEQIFGVLKAKWDILTRAPEYDMDIQARIPPALAAIHKFILKHDDVEWEDILGVGAEDPNPGT